MELEEGAVKADTLRDIAKVAIVERHKGTGAVTLGLVHGFGFNRKCAVASTVVHDSHQMIVVGTDEGSMAEVAANSLHASGEQMLGAVVGGFVSGAIAGRLKLKVEHSPKITSNRRLVFALMGGILFGVGSQLGRGCTSGSALSGMAVLSFGGIITMMGIFGGAYALAYFFKKLDLITSPYKIVNEYGPFSSK